MARMRSAIWSEFLVARLLLKIRNVRSTQTVPVSLRAFAISGRFSLEVRLRGSATDLLLRV